MKVYDVFDVLNFESNGWLTCKNVYNSEYVAKANKDYMHLYSYYRNVQIHVEELKYYVTFEMLVYIAEGDAIIDILREHTVMIKYNHSLNCLVFCED